MFDLVADFDAGVASTPEVSGGDAESASEEVTVRLAAATLDDLY